MLNAAEASIDAAAEDDAERARYKAKLYAPPKGEQRRSQRGRPPGMGMDRAAAQAMAAKVAAEDARLGAGP
ncbi:hypothetical protein [Streptomyces sp. NBC_00120]|uniref:hypothetical protein n=1 Tax=Streptomyces sp. NBC_00120 TaxID=2975660 RepID=UPI0022561098|nr:hypothetical protein [Streptomyces sp. NBC_00120]MCX5326274.1 hypothetical protein [Streptomyces sp. NBC_00120]